MLWLGWREASTLLASATSRAMAELQGLISSSELNTLGNEWLIGRHLHQSSAIRAQGQWCSISSETLFAEGDDESISWVGSPPPGDALAAGNTNKRLPLTQVTVRNSAGKTIAAVCLVEQALYAIEDVYLALRISVESHHSRPNSVPVLASARRPLPTLERAHHPFRNGTLAVFRCESPVCRSYGDEVLVQVNQNTETLRRGLGVAYPCPSCNGEWQARWALSFVRAFGPMDTHRVAHSVRYRVMPTRTRRTIVPGPMTMVEKGYTTVDLRRWLEPPLSSKLIRYLNSRRLPNLLAAIGEDPQRIGGLLPGLLTNDHFRTFVDFTRRLNPKAKRGGVATALAHGWYPRRASVYRVEFGQEQDSHHQYIALSPESFLDKLEFYGALNNKGRFLDIGSGIGEKVFLAYALGRFVQCDGLEYDPRTSAIASFLLQQIAAYDPYPIRLLQGDALTFEHYGSYSVIYMFRPMHDPIAMASLFRRIAKQMQPGAIVFDVHQEACGLKKMDDGTFVTVRPHLNRRKGVWDRKTTLEDFIAKHGFSQ